MVSPLDRGDGGVLVVKNLIVEERVDKGGDPDEAEHRLVAAGQLLATLHLRVTPKNQFLVVICLFVFAYAYAYLYSYLSCFILFCDTSDLSETKVNL